MLNLKSTDKLTLTRSSDADIVSLISYVDCDSTSLTAQTFQGNTELHAFNSAATNDVCVAPSANFERNVKFQSYINKDTVTSCDVTPKVNRSSTEYEQLPKLTLLPGESLVCREGVWFHFDASVGVYSTQLPVGSDTVVGGVQLASTGDVTTGTESAKVVVPARMKYHAGLPKAWVSCGVAADIQQSYGVTSLTDNGTGDVSVNFTTAFAAATYHCQVSVEMTTTTYVVASDRKPHVRSSGRATGSVRCDCIDSTASTNLVKDPTSWHIQCLGAW